MAIEQCTEKETIVWGIAPHKSSASFSPSDTNGYLIVKQACDFVLAIILVILASPVILIAGLLIRLTTRGPIFYSQIRLGRFGKPFRIYKLRTMKHRCESISGPQWSVPGDSRVTPIGRLLRKTHIDELPQLWNVIRGDMSLVGPRPERPEFVPELERQISHYALRLRVRPGITGLAQVHLPPDTDLESVRRKVAYDIYYVNKFSIWLDFRLVLCTGLKFVGVPYAFSKSLLRIPRGRCVEKFFQDEQSQSKLEVELQPA